MSTEAKLQDPAIKKAVKDALDEFVKNQSEIQSKKDHSKNIIEAISDLSGLDKKAVRKIARLYERQSLAQMETEFAEIRDLYEKIVG